MSILDLSAIQTSQPNSSAPVRTALLALESIGVPIGGSMPYDGTGDPAGGRFLLRDGRLIDKTTYADYFTAVGHAFNGGVDPGSNKVRIGDARGRVIMGSDNMGTAQGAAGRIAAAAARGNNGGTETNSHTVNSHTHTMANHVHFAPYAIGLRAGNLRVTGPQEYTAGEPGVGDSVGHTFIEVTSNVTGFELGGLGGLNSQENWAIASSVPNTNTSDAAAPGTNATSVLQPYEVSNYIVRVK